MRRFCILGLMVLGFVSARGAGAESVMVGPDGSIKVQLQLVGGKSQAQMLVFHFGLPAKPAERQWEENGVLRGLWVRNGVKYLQTVLVAKGVPEGSPEVIAVPGSERDVRSPEVLLVNIAGENTNADYAEASAELAVEVEGKRQSLELKDGLVWRVTGKTRNVVGALEIPESGIKTGCGDALRFYGNIPPSLKGSMTLKVALEAASGGQTPDWLKDMEFETGLRQVLPRRDRSMANTNGVRAVFGEAEQTRK